MPLTVVSVPTVTVKLVFVTNVPSVTLSVIVETPVCPLAGVTVTVRLVSVPPITTLALGTSVVFEDDDCRQMPTVSSNNGAVFVD